MPIDYSKYPKDWKTEIVPRILKRENNKCGLCGVENKTTLTSLPLRMRIENKYKIKRFWITESSDILRMKPYSQGGEIKEIKVVLTIAHLDHDEENHEVEDDRLMAMCQYCHLNYDAKEKWRRATAKKITPPI